MQIYFPLTNGDLSASCLDTQRLKALRSRGRRVLQSLLGMNTYYSDSAGCKDWRGHEWWLGIYIGKVCREYATRMRIIGRTRENEIAELVSTRCQDTGLPPWVGNPDYHRAHQSKLVFLGRKDRLYRAVRAYLFNTGTDRCVNGWLDDEGWSSLVKMQLPEVIGLEGRMNSLGAPWTTNFYDRYNWDVNELDEIPWPSLTDGPGVL